MRFNCKLTIWSVSLLVFSLLACVCQKDVGADPTAPDFSLSDLSGHQVTLQQHRGRVVLLDFWATWCPPCRGAIPELVKIQEKYRDKGLVILGISMDDPKRVSDEYLKTFGEKFKINYLILRHNVKVVENYFGRQAPAIPTMFVIDREGRIRDKQEGFNAVALRKSLERFMG